MAYHVIQKEWSLPPFDPNNVHVLPVEPLIALTRFKTPRLLELSDVCYRDRIVSDERLRSCDPSWPCIVAEDVANPCDRRYRLLDGNHRIHKLLAAGASRHWFYVFRLEEFQHFVETYDRLRHG